VAPKVAESRGHVASSKRRKGIIFFCGGEGDKDEGTPHPVTGDKDEGTPHPVTLER